MSKWSHDSDELTQRLARAKVVYEFHPDDIGIIDYLRQTSDRTTEDYQ